MVVRARRARMNPSIDEGLVVNHPFSEGVGSTIFDRSPYGVKGSLYNTAWQDTVYGMGLKFDGENGTYVECNKATEIGSDATTDPFSFICTFKFDGLTNGTNKVFQVLANRINGHGSRGFLYYHETNGSVIFQGQDDISNPKTHQLSGTNVLNGLKHSVVYTFDGSEMKGYWDGVYINSTTWIGGVYRGISFLRFGCGATTGHFVFNGVLYEFRVYDRCLSPQEVRVLHDMRRRV